MSYRLTSEFGVSHGKAVGVLLPWVCQFNLSSNYLKFSSLAKALGDKTENLISFTSRDASKFKRERDKREENRRIC